MSQSASDPRADPDGAAGPVVMTGSGMAEEEPTIRCNAISEIRECCACHRPLSGRQKRFCGSAGRFAAWNAEHPRKRPSRRPRDSRQSCRVRLSPFAWGWLTELAKAAGQSRSRVTEEIVAAALDELRREEARRADRHALAS